MGVIHRKQQRLVIVGIGGPSASGKTTVARYLSKILPNCWLIHQDDFYKPESEIPIDKETGLANWDIPEAIDIARFMDILGEAMESDHISEYVSTELPEDPNRVHIDEPTLSHMKSQFEDHLNRTKSSFGSVRFLLIDGFIMYCFPELVRHLDVKIFIKASYETLKRRREEKIGYTTLEGFWVDPPGYFDKIVWPNYLACNRHIINPETEEETVDGLVLFDSGAQTVVKIVTETLALIQQSIYP
ncbi:P-loop containing nucleoside triphosphate hydrolase protein [Basidiobolus meristosporus CBS 931.73]|uniref:p-loop containing nucleoside triphosphate hydrolase protein n=1 Tax=Basidiobolus meristosporus CBS 931.73 TaxID=1314790 RepID=A0A1Y1WV05_9FUNG|nr:P-loop containing nucleoside triphosphate hydrolase protein [Basidiobolus meristosporus CBS 931.73]|eukprot:ORX76954.1 P-loop containing nucleoside triphosphate hydrolase protein [Basidiobolus meristosporus CBS 931.73]